MYHSADYNALQRLFVPTPFAAPTANLQRAFMPVHVKTPWLNMSSSKTGSMLYGTALIAKTTKTAIVSPCSKSYSSIIIQKAVLWREQTRYIAFCKEAMAFHSSKEKPTEIAGFAVPTISSLMFTFEWCILIINASVASTYMHLLILMFRSVAGCLYCLLCDLRSGLCPRQFSIEKCTGLGMQESQMDLVIAVQASQSLLHLADQSLELRAMGALLLALSTRTLGENKPEAKGRPFHSRTLPRFSMLHNLDTVHDYGWGNEVGWTEGRLGSEMRFHSWLTVQRLRNQHL